MVFKSKREDKKGHRTPLSEKEISKAYSVKLPKSLWENMKAVPPEEVRKAMYRLAKRFN